MTEHVKPITIYRKGEILADGVIHALGLVLALVTLPVLLTLAAVWDGQLGTMVALSVYAASVLAMLALSGAYNLTRQARARAILRRLDHAAIYLKIAGTQTPFAVLGGSSTTLWLLAGVWVAALAAALAKIVSIRGWEMLSVALYLALGWAGVLILPGLWDELGGLTRSLILAGGILYTIGVGFHLWETLPYHNAIWHGFVLAGTFAFYAALLAQIAAEYG
ncbi:MAG TPA: hemolysin III family protein [Paracoccaceae bacterium]|nr:hemolysin III family protein [Paracoccaceae bacterium]